MPIPRPTPSCFEQSTHLASHPKNATITINVTTLNSNPSASDAEMTITEDSTDNEAELTLTDPDDDQIFVVELVDPPAHGTATFLANIAKYTPMQISMARTPIPIAFKMNVAHIRILRQLRLPLPQCRMLPVKITGVAEGTEDQELTFSLGLFVADPDDLSNPLAGLSFEMVTQPSGTGTISIDGQHRDIRTGENFFGTNYLRFQSFRRPIHGSIDRFDFILVVWMTHRILASIFFPLTTDEELNRIFVRSL